MSDITSAPPGLPFAAVPNVIAVDHGVKEACGERGPSATVRYFVPYTARWNFAKSVLGTSISAGPYSIRTIPAAFPPSPNLFALEIVEMGGIGKPIAVNGQLISTYAYVDVRFGVPPYRFDGSDPSGTPWTETTMSIGAQQYPMPESTFAFANGVRTTTNPQLMIPTGEFSFLRKWLAYWPVPYVLPLIGKVNNSGFLGCAAGTLLFMGAEPVVTADPVGNYVYDCTYRFSWRSQPWNYEINPDGISGWGIITDGSGNPPYASGDFTTLP